MSGLAQARRFAAMARRLFSRSVVAMQKKLVFFIFGLFLLTIAPLRAWSMQDEGVSLYGRTLLEQINLYRQDNGLNPLRFDAHLIHLAKNS